MPLKFKGLIFDIKSILNGDIQGFKCCNSCVCITEQTTQGTFVKLLTSSTKTSAKILVTSKY